MQTTLGLAAVSLAFIHHGFSQSPTPASTAPAPPAIYGLWLMGQSLCDGSESLPLVTTAPSTWGNLSFRRGVRTWVHGDNAATPELRPAGDFAFVPLQASANGALGETVANGLADHLTAASRARATGPSSTATGGPYLVAYAGQGGRQIQELSQADLSTDSRTPESRRHGGGYYRTSLDDARRAVVSAKSQGASFSISALYWMQGEANGGPTGGINPTRWDDEMKRPAGQEWYAGELMKYRRQWSADLCAITGQQEEIPMFTYQTLGPAGEAQLLAAARDEHITMVGPHYAVPSAINSRRPVKQHGDAIHLSADGERWWGEQVGKVMHRVLHEQEPWQPLRPVKAMLEPDRTSILLDFHVPRPPLVLDETFLPTQEIASGKNFVALKGFRVRGGTGALLTAVETAGPTTVRLHLASPVPAGEKLTVDYGHSQAAQIGSIVALHKGPDSDGQGTQELVITGSLASKLKLLTDEGAFFASNQESGTAYARAPIRHVFEENGTTVLRFETRELRNGVNFAVGQSLVSMRPFSYGNLHDSDPGKSIYTFGDASYGTRAGQPYPLWNWCVLFSDLRVEEGE